MQTNPSSEFLVLDNVVLTQTELTMLVERSECLDRIHKLLDVPEWPDHALCAIADELLSVGLDICSTDDNLADI
ncbi:hypothetical protein GCM10009425_40770 [Pseudomonas asuensis]|uniref:Uncharacterized protein n=1 Tax=Pseudomonas asuensis TaxID=1825787 RepID=A0ABQ2H1E4_9PSED|nr:hypothetical protein [Pseudomonas asuensis]GGM25876.1 hypothetical protein GCM10009425_40770 [Pseudomonas asuensis]